ncbi:hypothetical protein IW262DRAFT_1455110 [Armillaria fumosa]|nr:hypothetical protein IW262DRAFT_1455110 [Armillaria fumosa]
MGQHYISLSFLFSVPRASWLREKAKDKFQTRRATNASRGPMSAFLDLEARVDRQEVLKSSDEEVNEFIEDAEEDDDTSDADDAPTTGPSAVPPVIGHPEADEPWTGLLERARTCATRGPMVGGRSDDSSIHDVPPEFWVLTVSSGWEDVVVFHIGRCA